MISAVLDFFHYDFLFRSLVGIILLSVSSGFLSPIIVAKRFSFLGEGLAHGSFFGISLTYALGLSFLAHPVASQISILIMTISIAMGLGFFCYRQPIPKDSIIGVFLSVSLAFGILIQSIAAIDNAPDLTETFFGNILLLNNQDLVLLFIFTCIISLSIGLNYRKWILWIYDEEEFRLNYKQNAVYHYGLFFLLALFITIALKLMGTLIINSTLIIPGIVAYKFSSNMKRVFILATLFGLIFSTFGLFWSNFSGFPPGACIGISQFCGIFVTHILQRALK